MSVFFTDSDCELWFDKVDAEKIEFFPMPYVVDGEEFFYDMGRNTDIKAFFDKMRAGASVKTCALNAEDYAARIEPVYAAGEDIIYVSFSHKMSGTFNSLGMALDKLKEKYPERKTTVVDTKSISAAGGLIAYEAAKLHNAGASDEEVVKFVESIRDRIKCYFTVDDLIYLKRGGRISAVKAALGTLFKVKPIICTVNGALENVEKFKGRFRSLKALAEYVDRDGADEKYPIILVDADSPDDVAFVREHIAANRPDAELWNQPVGPVIGAHCGPDTVGVIFVSKEK